MDLVNQLYLDAILYLVSQALLAPVIIVLLAFIVYGLWCIGSIVVETFTERLNFRENMPAFLGSLSRTPQEAVARTIADSGLLRRQKAALLTLWDHRFAPEEACTAIARRLVAGEDERYRRIFGRNDVVSKVAPMFGLMGTLIPLGPGIVALGQGDTATLSSSLGVAFNTTVAGLIVAAVCYVVARIRKGWYASYMVSLETAASTLLELVADLRMRDEVDITSPGTAVSDYGLDADGRLRLLAKRAAGEQYVPEGADARPPAAAEGDGTGGAL